MPLESHSGSHFPKPCFLAFLYPSKSYKWLKTVLRRFNQR
nr:MAG TPA: Protein of unknown function (DUF1560) [Caudoviricetes sp.]DAS11418.1 MAG TPA: Protein of unknown function (DUF1560) [Caudoviricetes sp.]